MMRIENVVRDSKSRIVIQRLLTADHTALLKTTGAAVYAMAEPGELPGIIRIGRRLLVDLLAWAGN